MESAKYTTSRTTQFAEGDSSGIIHFSNFAVYIEEAEHQILDFLGYAVEVKDSYSLHWPRLQFSATYTEPLFPFEEIEIELTPKTIGKTSIIWEWEILRKSDEKQVANGEMKVVCCRKVKGVLSSVPLAQELKDKLNDLT